ncbi:MAG: Uncharacterised protein [Porticoccaceae bacterium UBA1117]|nr:MAG: Uncharacterised protein [Porticoccaceae bacterium UBA1117]
MYAIGRFSGCYNIDGINGLPLASFKHYSAHRLGI